MSSKNEPLANVDAAWLSMDDPTNLMMITGVMTFKNLLNMDHLMAIINHRWLKFERFKQRVSHPRLPGGTPYWEVDPNFDLRAHIRRVALPEPGDQNALQELVSDLMSTPLDPSKPLWQMHIVENFEGGSAIINRIHHCIADGMALMYVLFSLTDMTPDAPWPEEATAVIKKQKQESSNAGGGPIGSLFKQGVSIARTTRSVTGKLVQESWTTVNHPSRATGFAQTGAEYSKAAARLALYSVDPATPFKGKLGVSKKGAWSRPLPLKDVKRIKAATSTTVNDVLVAAMSGAVRRYMLEKGVDPVDFRAVIPVNMRKPEEMEQMGNKFGLVFLSLPISFADPIERLAEVNKRMTALKNSAEAGVALGILNAMGLSPSEIQSIILKTFAMKATTVLTNVPGPPVPLFLAGSEIEDIMFWVPQSGRLGMGISIFSYAGKVYMGVATDNGLVSDPDRIVDHFYTEFDLLLIRLNLREPATTKTDRVVNKSTQVDDLTVINGIGPKVADILYKEGITNYDQLAEFEVTALEALLATAGDQYQRMDATSWPVQARYLASIRN